MKILLLRTWLTNIGNGFIDKGARALIEAAAPEATIIESSGYSQFIANWRSQGEFAGIGDYLGNFGYEIQQKRQRQSKLRDTVITCAELTDADVAVLPGCVLYESGFNPYLPVLEDLRKRDIPLVILGGGGGAYDEQTVSFTREVLEAIQPFALISRDRTAYEKYESSFTRAVDGIDCAFFIDWYHEPAAANRSFVAATFDKTEEPALETEDAIIRPHHKPFGEPLHHWGYLSMLNAERDYREFLKKEHAFISDTLEDYLFIYGNAEVTHADRIHACVPSLVYGNRAQFHYETPRGGLFDRILTKEKDITRDAVKLDRDELEPERERQVSELATILEKAVSG